MCERRDTHKTLAPGKFFRIPPGQENIRILPYERCYTGRLHDAMNARPIVKDPYAHLYMGAGRFTMPSKKAIEGLIDLPSLMRMVRIVSYRRRIMEGTIAPYNIAANPLEILHSILPKERDLDRLYEMAQKDSSAMLQLADVYQFGLLGTQIDVIRSAIFYKCAAIGLNEQECISLGNYKWKFAYPMGNPEALTAIAYDLWKFFCTMDISDDDEIETVLNEEDPDDFDSVLSKQVTSSGLKILEKTAACLSHAIRRGWISPFSLRFAKAVSKNTNLLHSLYPYSVQLESSVNCNEKRHKKSKHEEPVLSYYQMKCFTPHATRIFLDLPIFPVWVPSYIPTDVHIEYRESISPQKKIFVMVTTRIGYYYTFTVPDKFKYTPFANEALEYVWARVVFIMHQGDFWKGARFRPHCITFADHPADQLLAEYVMKQVGFCGTIIQIIDPSAFYVMHGNEHLPFEKVLNLVEVATVMKEKISTHNVNYIRKEIEEKQINKRFNSRPAVPVQTLCSNLTKLNNEGCEYYQQSRIQAARRCYTEAINSIQSNTQFNSEVLELLSKLLYNRSACFLDISEGMSLGSAMTTLKNGLDDCENALKLGVSSPVLISNIEKRKQLINIRISQLAIGPSHTEIQAPSSRRGKRKPKSKKKQQRRQRSSLRQQHNPNEKKKEPPRSEDREDDRDLITIATGNKLFESKITSFVSGREDVCPCCVDRFSIELDDVFCAINPCGHVYCLPCLSLLLKKSQKGSNPLGFNCPICRVPIQKDLLSDAVDPIVSCIPCLQERITSLPLNWNEGMQVVKELCLRHDFKMPNVLSALDLMLTDGLQASLRSSKNLSPAKKQEIYETARAPVDSLWIEARKLRLEMDFARDVESKTYRQWKKGLIKLQTILIPAATKTAVDFIWEKLNSAGSMGIESSSGEIEIDFHALHVGEAKERFHERVLPILPAVESILLVVGSKSMLLFVFHNIWSIGVLIDSFRLLLLFVFFNILGGNHSEGGNAKLKPALKKIIDNHSKIRFNNVEGNEGMIRVRWVH